MSACPCRQACRPCSRRTLLNRSIPPPVKREQLQFPRQLRELHAQRAVEDSAVGFDHALVFRKQRILNQLQRRVRIVNYTAQRVLFIGNIIVVGRRNMDEEITEPDEPRII